MTDMGRSGRQTVFSKYTGTDECFAVPEYVTEIAEGAFSGNKSLKHIDLGNVRSVGAYAFQECSNLESVIMRCVTVIGRGAFEFCRSLSNITLGDVTEIGENAFSFCGMLDIPMIPRSVTHLGSGAFSHTAVRRAEINWLSEIPAHLFSCCTSLGYADISGAAVIGDGAFAECRALSYVRFGDAEKIGERAFYRCGSFELTALPDTLTELGDDAFCVIRPGLVIPMGVRQIGSNCLGPVDRRKKIKIYRSSLYEFRNYFRDNLPDALEEDSHFYLWESSIDVTVLEDGTDNMAGFLPLFSDIYDVMRSALIVAFRTDNTFDYPVLDTVFWNEMRWNQKGKDRLACMRLKYPYELTESARSMYTDYLFRHSDRIARRAVRDRDIDILIFLCENGMIGKDNITGLLDYAITLSASECTALLLERQSELNRYNAPLLDEL